jgi:hypothetical protein
MGRGAIVKEYVLHVWGGFFNAEHAEKHKQKEGFYWFNSKYARARFRRKLVKMERKYDAHSLAFTEYDGPLIRKRTIAKMVFVYKGIEYPFSYDYGYGYEADNAYYHFHDGDYSCDCNRSLFIQRMGHDDFPAMECGNEISIKDFEVVYQERSGAKYEPFD